MWDDFAIDFAERNKDKPFFIYYPMALVHGPHWPTPDDQPEDNQKNKNAKQNFQSNVEYTDKIVGKLIAALANRGMLSSTVSGIATGIALAAMSLQFGQILYAQLIVIVAFIVSRPGRFTGAHMPSTRRL